LNNVHFSYIHIEQCSFSAETPKMQTLSFEVAATFVDDAAALTGGAGRIITQILTSPVERLASACDVAGVLPRRRAFRQALRQTFGAKTSRATFRATWATRRQRGWRNCLFPLRGLRDLT
jgi:hypothetical protein